MAKSKQLEETLERLARVRDEPGSDASLAELRAALAGKLPHAAARAAQIAAEFEIESLTRDLVTAFDRLLVNPVQADPQCVAKTAIVEALQRWGAAEPGVYLRGIRYVQLEPVWGGRADTAVALRGASAFGLVAMGHRDALTPLAELLADPEARARAAAARALAAREDPGGVPLLRLKALVGDADAEVVSDCLSGLLALDPESVDFVAGFLSHTAEETREAAALALGSSRRAEALAPLRQCFEQTAAEGRRRTALLAIAMLKTEAALGYLLELVHDAAGPTARQAIEALALHRYDEALVGRVRAAAERDDADLNRALADAFPRP